MYPGKKFMGHAELVEVLSKQHRGCCKTDAFRPPNFFLLFSKK